MLLRLPISDLVLMHRPERSDWVGLLLEIPERQVVNKIELLKLRVPKLQQAGVSMAIDNFGRGLFLREYSESSPVLGNQNRPLSR
jgi:EAL domain-containing protein (putative c-di-GMP-specific phosphodiesterase class I)